jgi:hypothetical protein
VKDGASPLFIGTLSNSAVDEAGISTIKTGNAAAGFLDEASFSSQNN